jgi:hypothetical protein
MIERKKEKSGAMANLAVEAIARHSSTSHGAWTTCSA